MAEPETDRPGSSSAAHRAISIPTSLSPSTRPLAGGRSSRSSLRRELDVQDIGQDSRPAHDFNDDDEGKHLPYYSASADFPPPLPTPQSGFAPLFTFLTSTSQDGIQQTIHYPTVRYVFADDDPEILTAELAQHHHSYDEEDEDVDWERSPRDRALIIDMERTSDGAGLEVAWASSLSPDWAVTSARVSTLQSGNGGTSGGLMLRIDGVSLEETSAAPSPVDKVPNPEADLQSSGPSTARQQDDQQSQSTEVEYGTLLLEFERRMEILRRVAEAGAERQRILRDAGSTVVDFSLLPGAVAQDDTHGSGDGKH
ncbi:hypothetical protein QBC35DRAFT_384131 [Podospora australis]|uniref:Uncharacterized protein n=1 Tax=Podospora australis TaxID=1536484 RepID=A0AAN6WUC3_9PEZI|nr:hypothetical protein QBC35DRAFT_384131 [Podospora australis]